jgi:methylthioribose-1-phosphate isomerase
MIKNNYFSIKFFDDKLSFLDQTKLPLVEDYVETDDFDRIAEAIERLEVRGAPLIGVAAAYGLALSIKNIPADALRRTFYLAYQRLLSTRPTAVNLFYSLNELKNVFEENKDSENLYDLLIERAKKIHKEDTEMCEKIAQNGLKIFKKKSNVLTHCNTGKLATAGGGTAFYVIQKGYEHNLINKVYADETRPLLQGSRLTAFELHKAGIPFAIQTDSTAAVLMQQNQIDLVIVGADRIALNGDTANKIGTYNLAISCNYHNIPFYVAAPSTTIDRNIPAGNEIDIEYRNKNEVLSIGDMQIAHVEYEAFSPAFDVTPSHLISGIITDEDLFLFPYNFIR